MRCLIIIIGVLALSCLNCLAQMPQYGCRLLGQSSFLSPEKGTELEFQQDLTISFNVWFDEGSNGDVIILQSPDGTDFATISKDNGNITCKVKGNPLKNITIPSNKSDLHIINLRIERPRRLLIVNIDGGTPDIAKMDRIPDHLTFSFGNRRGKGCGMIINDVHIQKDETSLCFWQLKEHDGDISKDQIKGRKIISSKCEWQEERHRNLKLIFHASYKGSAQTAYNPKENIVYILTDSQLLFYDCNRREVKITREVSGERTSDFSNTLIYNAYDNSLLSIMPDDDTVSVLSLDSMIWRGTPRHENVTRYASHAWASNDSVGYCFGGYGYYTFYDNLFKVNLRNSKLTEIPYSPRIKARTGASAGMLGSHLYIYGGRGIQAGDKSSAQFYHDLTCIDLKSMRTSFRDLSQEKYNMNYVLTSTMYYNEMDSSFYAGAYRSEGIYMLRIPINGESPQIMSERESIPKIKYMEMNLDLYSPDSKEVYYYVVNKYLEGGINDISIYEILLPLIPPSEDFEAKHEESGAAIWICGGILIFGGISLLIFVGRRRKKRDKDTDTAKVYPAIERTRVASIRLLGEFAIHDAEGKDHSSEYTGRMRQLLELLLLNCMGPEGKISIERVDECLWGDRAQEQARTSRNVYMRKLRRELERLNPELRIEAVKGAYHIYGFEKLEIDYLEVVDILKQGLTKENIGRFLAIASVGPILPAENEPWLDRAKADYSGLVISTLEPLLSVKSHEFDSATLMRLTDVVLVHDPLNELAVKQKIAIYREEGKGSMARSASEKFHRDYKKMMGTSYDGNI